jgi:hypothetical protein
MEQKIGEGPRHAAAALFHERAFGLTIIPRMTAAKTLELLNPKGAGFVLRAVDRREPATASAGAGGRSLVTRSDAPSRRPPNVANCGRVMEQILEQTEGN